eukprot:CAMPEP_0177547400 /NCGR_PEP_ID=MMETSP0369-20130122/63806_1 /TAXON_ID=447022 ORGANISM="Scrippsiella hangoei-like, Strain SHHI-4" /NCGR_SAMPLE_ID=MMETSP0369 /ASSEMBLY_ACC=CAM_ASM_000364 /LENGTH=60 /DNA_ID=CAMNT_0019032107 /DNA_START=239 /DNA_END=418 /DNA_ORIENTATION=+
MQTTNSDKSRANPASGARSGNSAIWYMMSSSKNFCSSNVSFPSMNTVNLSSILVAPCGLL